MCAPHAGGTAQAYRTWHAGLPAGIEVIGVQYPGRQDRLGEPVPASMDELVGPVADAVEPSLGEPLALFGHSMGAVVAYEVTLELERRHGQVVDLLAVSGSRAPHHREKHERHALDDAALIEELRRLNDDFTDLLDAPELLELILPAIRADFGVVARYLRTPPLPVRAPLLALGGSSDPDVAAQDLTHWRACAGGAFSTRVMAGGHFYLADQAPVLDALAPWLPHRRPTAHPAL
ncbi:thioesterase II family protein [Streptomyces lydicus]|uniref:thioesterase II family protein n=1 Tax=Streptomyces lydicus TaxID=47763 RepID=UPI001F512021|nr:alpha/beta fold hydrolase [Streptomyces lydicus]MCZ1006991.1 alpha/beta fold hydrolase [Streptomyces lydicus]